MSRRTSAIALALMTGAVVQSTNGAPVVVPVGVQNDVSIAGVAADGWSVIFETTYDDSTPYDIATITAGAGTHLMLAAYFTGSSTYDVLAAAPTADVLTLTAINATHAANGVEWYLNHESWGFAGLGDSIHQSSADTNGPSERDRLSWHTNPGGPLNRMQEGWRSGDNTGLNESNTWRKVILTADVAAVPEPTSLALFGLTALGMGVSLRRRRERAAENVQAD